LRLVVDTNIILKAIIRDSRVRAILLSPNHEFYVPEYSVEEVEEHMSLLRERTRLSEEEIRSALRILLTNIQVIPARSILTKWSEAEEIMRLIDRNDIPFVAASLSTACDGIWSDDKDLKRQRRVRIWSTSEMMRRG